MFRRKKPPPLSREESLACVVVPNDGLRVTSDEDGNVTLSIPIQVPRWLGRFSKSAESEASDRKIELDEVGSFVWGMCHERTTVRQMIRRLSERYKLNMKEAEVSLTAFLRTLAKKRLVAVVLPQSARRD